MAELDRRALCPPHAQLDPAAEILPHVEHIRPRTGVGHLHGQDGVCHPDRRHHLRRHFAFGRIQHCGRLPPRALVRRHVPPRGLKAGIVEFAVVDAVGNNRAGVRRPRGVGHDFRVLLAALHVDVQLQHQGPRAVPSLAEHGRHGVGALLKVLGDVVAQV